MEFGMSFDNMYKLHKPSTIVDEVSNMTYNQPLKSLFESYGLNVMNVTWEDTARNKNSCWGPNISDMTLCLPSGKCMPVIRKPNFADVSVDYSIDKLSVVVGNESGKELKKISLKEYLQNIDVYTANTVQPMFKQRDEKILTSSQCCVLPVEKDKVDFSVKLYNYQSYKENPKVLVIVSSSMGTSCQIVNGNSELHFNDKGTASRFRVQRLEDDRKERKVETTGKITKEEKQNNVLFIYQIPLKNQEDYVSKRIYNQNYDIIEEIKDINNYKEGFNYTTSLNNNYMVPLSASYRGLTRGISDDDSHYNNLKQFKKSSRGFDHGILSYGDTLGKYTGVGIRKLVRDESFPIRLTIQHYRVTDTLEGLNSDLVKEISEDITNIYTMGENISSLVVEGDTKRTTEPTLSNVKDKRSMPFFNF